MKNQLRYLIPFGVGLLAAALLAGLYFAIVSWAESPAHALDLVLEDRWLVLPILLGFGVQAGLYSVLKLRLYLPANQPRPDTAIHRANIGAGGATSTVAMVACCAHHVTDVLPVLGLTAAATFLAEYQTAFMVVGLISNLIGIGFILKVLLKTRREALLLAAALTLITEGV